MPLDNGPRGFIIAYSPQEAKVNELLQPSLQARLQMKPTDKWVRYLGKFWAEVELRSKNDAVVTQLFTEDSVLQVQESDMDTHHGNAITLDFKFNTLKIGTPGSYKFHVRLYTTTTTNSADGNDLGRFRLEATSPTVEVS